MEIKRCGTCNNPVNKDWNYCDMCGQKLKEPHHFPKPIRTIHINCNNCNFIIKKYVEYCVNCGHKNKYLENIKKIIKNKKE